VLREDLSHRRMAKMRDPMEGGEDVALPHGFPVGVDKPVTHPGAWQSLVQRLQVELLKIAIEHAGEIDVGEDEGTHEHRRIAGAVPVRR
jgi:hypothetical protein